MSLTMLRSICRQQNLLLVQRQMSAAPLVCSRFCHGQPPPRGDDNGDKQQPNAKEKLAVKYSRENVKRNVQGYVFSRFFDYVKNYDKVLEKKFPSAMHVYRVFLVGVKEFFNDMKKLVKITKIVYTHDNDLRCLTRKEIELYYQMPRDMKKVAPVLLISALPFANYVQRGDFAQLDLKQRLQYNRRVFRCMQAKLDSMRKTKDPQFDKCSYILGLLGSGLHPTSAEILDVKDLFTRAPFGLQHLSSVHLKYLCRLHDLRPGLMRRYRLSERAYVVHHMDLAIKREGGVHNMPIESLKHACFLRGLNATNLSAESMIAWLNEWVEVSLIINQDNISLFLHLPILLSYNHPNNWILKG